jgi:hypothetical protein
MDAIRNRPDLSVGEWVAETRDWELFICNGTVMLNHKEVYDNDKPRGGQAFVADRSAETNLENAGLFDLYFQYLGVRHPATSDRAYDVNAGIEPGTYWPTTIFATNNSKYVMAPGTETIDGVECYVLEAPGEDKWWVDTTESHLPRRRLYNFPNYAEAMWLDISYLDYEEVASGVSLPRRLVVRDYCRPSLEPEKKNKLQQIFTFDVQEFTIGEEVPDAMFNNVTLRKHTLVHDYRLGRSTTLDSDKEAFLASVETIADSLRIYRAERSKRMKWMVGIAIGLALAAAIAAVLLRRRGTS